MLRQLGDGGNDIYATLPAMHGLCVVESRRVWRDAELRYVTRRALESTPTLAEPFA
jgi:hypothetical protein